MHLATGQKIWRWKWQSGTVGSVAASPFWFRPERCLFSVWGFARSPGFYMSFLLVLWFTPTSQKPWWWIVYNKLPLSMDVFCNALSGMFLYVSGIISQEVAIGYKISCLAHSLQLSQKI